MRWQMALAVLALAVPAAADRYVHSDRYEESGRLLVQMRPIFEALDAEVVWNAALRQITSTRGPLEVVMRIDDRRAFVNRAVHYLEVPPRLIGSTTRVPLRFVGEAFGGMVTYLGDRVRIEHAGPDTVIVYLDGARPAEDSWPHAPVPPEPVPGRWPFTASRAVSDADMAPLNNWDLTLMCHEILARYGAPFRINHLDAYFRAQSWYHPRADFVESCLNAVERGNFHLIRRYQVARYGHAAIGPPDGRWPFTCTRAVTAADLLPMTNWNMTLMRSEIKARKGGASPLPEVTAYFRRQAWYRPTDEYRDTWLIPLERSNWDFILNYQRARFGAPATAPPP